MIRGILVIGVVMAAATIGLRPPSSQLVGVVIDARTHEPVADATVTVGSFPTTPLEGGRSRAVQ
ncbi:MAG: hypothetical protein WEB50_12690 [Vicinamibacterales bacterium]